MQWTLGFMLTKNYQSYEGSSILGRCWRRRQLSHHLAVWLQATWQRLMMPNTSMSGICWALPGMVAPTGSQASQCYNSPLSFTVLPASLTTDCGLFRLCLQTTMLTSRMVTILLLWAMILLYENPHSLCPCGSSFSVVKQLVRCVSFPRNVASHLQEWSSLCVVTSSTPNWTQQSRRNQINRAHRIPNVKPTRSGCLSRNLPNRNSSCLYHLSWIASSHLTTCWTCANTGGAGLGERQNLCYSVSGTIHCKVSVLSQRCADLAIRLPAPVTLPSLIQKEDLLPPVWVGLQKDLLSLSTVESNAAQLQHLPPVRTQSFNTSPTALVDCIMNKYSYHPPPNQTSNRVNQVLT